MQTEPAGTGRKTYQHKHKQTSFLISEIWVQSPTISVTGGFGLHTCGSLSQASTTEALRRSEFNLSVDLPYNSRNKDEMLLGSAGKKDCPFQSTLRNVHYPKNTSL